MEQAHRNYHAHLAEYLVAALAVAGLFLRLINLEHLNYWGDESITALAVQGIFEHGYPRFPSGMIYFRGLPAIYLSALSASLWGMSEWALRLPSVLFSCGTIVLIHALGKRLFSPSVGLIAAFILTCSYWDFEFARHARMYASFAFFFLLALYAIYRGAVEGERRWYCWSMVISAGAIFFHELGLTLALVYLALAVRLGDSTGLVKARLAVSRWSLFGAALMLVALIGAHFILIQYGFAIPGQEQGHDEFARPFQILSGLFQKFHGVLPSQVMFDLWPLALMLMVLMFLVKRLRREQKFCAACRWLLPVAVFWASYGRQFTLAVLLVCGYLFFTGRSFDGFRRPEVKLASGLIVILLGFWMVHDWQSCQITGETQTLVSRGREVLKMQAGLPKLYYLGFLNTFPIMALLAGAAILLLVHASRVDKLTASDLTELVPGSVEPLAASRKPAGHTGAYFTCMAFILPMIATGYIKTNWVEYRLNFHLNPLFVLLYAFISWEIFHGVQMRLKSCRLSRFWRAVASLSTGLLLILSCEQINPWRLTKVLTRTYGSKVDPRSAPGSHFRLMPDHEHPGRFVKQYHQPQDIIIAMDWLAQSYYAGHIDFWLRSDAFVPQTYRVGKYYFDIYTGTQVISNLHDLERVIAEHVNRRIWIITASPYTEADLHVSPEIMSYLHAHKQAAVFQGRDDKSLVYLFSAQPPHAALTQSRVLPPIPCLP